jgi:hypothetical protein
MRRALFATILLAAIAAASAASARVDGVHLEVAAGVTPTFVHDPGYEALSRDDLRAERFGGDLRVEVAKFGHFRLAPYLSYRGAIDEGEPYGVVDTRLDAHDFAAGLRLRTWFLSWLGAFLQAEGGITYARVGGELIGMEGVGPGVPTEYSDKAATWLAGGMLGVELRLPPAVFKRRNVDWLGFGLEIGGGYLRRGEIDVAPTLAGGDENSLATAGTEGWGSVNLSGWTVQVMLTVSLF